MFVLVCYIIIKHVNVILNADVNALAILARLWVDGNDMVQIVFGYYETRTCDYSNEPGIDSANVMPRVNCFWLLMQSNPCIVTTATN